MLSHLHNKSSQLSLSPYIITKNEHLTDDHSMLPHSNCRRGTTNVSSFSDCRTPPQRLTLTRGIILEQAGVTNALTKLQKSVQKFVNQYRLSWVVEGVWICSRRFCRARKQIASSTAGATLQRHPWSSCWRVLWLADCSLSSRRLHQTQHPATLLLLLMQCSHVWRKHCKIVTIKNKRRSAITFW